MAAAREPEVRELPKPSLPLAVLPIAVTMGLILFQIAYFGADNFAPHIPLALGVAFTGAVGWAIGYRWRQMETGLFHVVHIGLPSVAILMTVGMIIGTWILSGTVPVMIHYGLILITPQYFLLAAMLLTALVSVAIGTSWGTVGTVGLALVGIGDGLGIPMALTGGAIVSGAFFGDKMSPLSDTTNLAPAVAGTELFTHIRHMTHTTGPSFLIALAGFTLVGFIGEGPSGELALGTLTDTLATNFDVGVWTLLPLAAVLGLAIARYPALPVILFGALLGAVFAVIFQPQTVAAYGGAQEIGHGMALLKGAWIGLFNGYTASTGNEVVDSLLSRGGMSSVLTTVWLIISALTLGAVLEHAGMLQRIIQGVIRSAKSTGSLITSVVLTSIGTNIVTGDQYIAIVMPGRMFRAEFRRRRLRARNLSRTIEDAGTLTSPLIPWNTCGAYMAATLGVATFAYLPWCFLNLVNPFVAMLLGFRGLSVEKVPEGVEMPEVDSGARA